MPSPNRSGRPKGIVDRRMRLQKALMGDAETLLAVATAKALEGDPQMLSLLISRAIPVLKSEGPAVCFAFNPHASLTEQFNQLMQAIANGQLTIEEGQRVADMLRVRAEIAALEGKGGDAQKLVDAFKHVAQTLANDQTR